MIPLYDTVFYPRIIVLGMGGFQAADERGDVVGTTGRLLTMPLSATPCGGSWRAVTPARSGWCSRIRSPAFALPLALTRVPCLQCTAYAVARGFVVSCIPPACRHCARLVGVGPGLRRRGLRHRHCARGVPGPRSHLLSSLSCCHHSDTWSGAGGHSASMLVGQPTIGGVIHASPSAPS